MKITKMLFSGLLALTLTALPVSSAFASDTRVELEAQIMNVKGGADSIATLTYDDGHLPTARKVNEWCKEYGVKASLMLYKSALDTSEISELSSIFAEGYLSPESHGFNHTAISNTTNNTDEIIDRELVQSKAFLEEKFPSSFISTYAMPSSTMSTKGYETLMQHYYAARGGSTDFNKVQSTNPAANTTAAGGWYSPYIMRFQAASNPDKYSRDAILSYIDKVVAEKGWLISLCHAVADDGTEGSHVNGINKDMYDADMEAVFEKLAAYSAQGKMWVTSYSDAVRYIREFQSSTVSAYSLNGGYYVDVTMAAATPEGLALDADIFNMPLTVKIALPQGWKSVECTQGASVCRGEAFYEGGNAYAYVEVVPNGGTATLTNPADSSDYVEGLDLRHNLSIEDKVDYTLYVPKDSYVVSARLIGSSKTLLTSETDNALTFTVTDIRLSELDRSFTLELSLDDASGYDPYDLSLNVLDYFEDLAASEQSTEAKALSRDFLLYAKELLLDKDSGADVSEISRVAGLFGTPPTRPALDTSYSDVGELGKFLSGAELTVNEKLYYVFYLKEGFFGTLTFTTPAGTVEYQVRNGRYHTKNYIVVDAGGAKDLTSPITLTAIGTDASAGVTASGEYSLLYYRQGMADKGLSTPLIEAVYSYAVSAREYVDSLN